MPRGDCESGTKKESVIMMKRAYDKNTVILMSRLSEQWKMLIWLMLPHIEIINATEISRNIYCHRQ